MKTTRILFVCLGNICRSPLAEALFKHHVKDRQIQHFFEADSCGTSNYHIGDIPDRRTIANATRNGVQIDHRARQLSESDLESFDLILAMDHSNLRNIMRLSNASQFAHKVKLMREYDPFPEGKEVPDPYHGDERDFQEVFDILHRSTSALVDALHKP